MELAIYRCISCHARATGTHQAPAEWKWNLTQVPRLLCPKCGCACVPEGWQWAAFEETARDDPPKLDIHAMAHERWSRCPNSLACQIEGTYAGDCEQATHVMPKCLAAIHSRLAHVERALAASAGTTRGRQGARQGALPPTSTTESAESAGTRLHGAAPRRRAK